MSTVAAIRRLAIRSLWNRKGTALLSMLAIAISVTLLLSVERIRTGARAGFTNTISGTDLIVGSRTGDIQLLLYSVFRIGNVGHSLSWKSFDVISNHPDVAWAVPLSLGDTHRSFKVLGTNDAYFEHYRYANRRSLAFSEGMPMGQTLDAVLGSRVADELEYQLGDQLVVDHGLGRTSFLKHDQTPFTVVGILSPTGTPVDRTVHVGLSGIQAIHGESSTLEVHESNPEKISAALVGLGSRSKALQLQRQINDYTGEPLTAILPGVVLQQLWQFVRVAEFALLMVSVLVVLAGLIGLTTTLLISLNERRREMAILRALGARLSQVFGLMMTEVTFLALGGAILGIMLHYLLLFTAGVWLEREFGLVLGYSLSMVDLLILGLVVAAALLMGLFPAWRAYRQSLSDGLVVST